MKAFLWSWLACGLAGPALGALPAGWSDADIGAPGLAGAAGMTNGMWTVSGSGADIWNNADQFNLASTPSYSDGTLVALVTGIQNSDPGSGWSKAGLMFRNDNTAGSVNVTIVATAGQGVSFQWRPAANGACSYSQVTGIPVPVWLKLARAGQNFSGSYSTDGTNWVQVATQQIPMNSTVLAGLGVTAHNNAALNTATYTNVSFTAVTNLIVANAPASPVLTTSATLNGQVVSPGVGTPSVTIFYGTSDGVTNPAAWSRSIPLGLTNGNFSANVSGLSTNTTYYFTAYASNSAAVSWAQPSFSFTTLSGNASLTRVEVTTYHYDNTRQGANTNETWLTPGNVNTNTFGKLFSYALDGYVFAEPLLLTNLTIPGLGTHNVVFVATEHDTLYALDADSNSGPNGGVLWTNNLGLSANSASAPFGYRYSGGGYTDIVPEVGMTSTPVIDPAIGTIYVNAFTRDIAGSTTNFVHRIHALDVTTGAERPYSPVIVAGSVPGTGVGSSGGVQTFSAIQHGQRPALCLANGLLIVSYASYADTDPYHGWVFAYNATNLALKGVFNTTPNATVAVFGSHAAEGGIWMGGGGICVDANNNLYFETGNGSFSANTNGGDYADSFVKLSVTNTLSTNILSVADYFTPFDQLTLANNDTDLGSCGPLLLPDAVGSVAHPHLIVGPGKSGKIYLVDRDNMGRFQNGSDSQIVESFNGISGSWSPPAYWNHLLFFQASSAALKSFSISNGVINQTAVATAPVSVGGVNGSPVVSANGNNNGIVWVMNNNSGNSGSPATLYALDAANVSQVLWSSEQLASRDSMGPGAKMSTPMVAGGKVYAGGQYSLSVYGLAAFLSAPVIAPAGGVFTNSVIVTISNTSPGSVIYYTTDGTTPTTNSTLYSGPFVLTKTTTVQAISAQPGYVNSGAATASFVNSLSLPPAPWQTSDVGAVAAAGGAFFSNGVFIVTGSGDDIWNTADAFRFVYRRLTNGCDISARVTSQVNTDPWAKAGVMIRDSLNPGAAYGCMVITPGNGTDFQYRTANGVAASGNASGGALNPAPNNWVRLTRTNNTFTAYKSANGMTWTQVGTPTTLTLTNSGYYVGLAVTAHNNGALSTAGIDNVTVDGFTYSNPPPAVVLTEPATNAAYTAAASVTISAEADALYDAITRVDFYANSTLVGSVSNVPFTLTATGLGAGAYALKAVAVSSSGLLATSAPVSITVSAATGQPYGLTNRPTVTAFLNLPTTSSGSLPGVLSGTGVFSNTTNRTATAGLLPYAPNSPQSKDNALSSWLMAVPYNGGLVTPDQQIGFQPTNSWTFPAGTVFVKNFDLVVNETNAAVRRLETQLLVRDINGAVYGATYKWRADNSDADLLGSSLSEGILITNASGVRTQTWTYPSPSDCLSCHTPVANYVLGANTRQLNGALSYPSTGVTDNQVRALNRLGLFNPAINESVISGYAQMTSITNTGASLQQRVRSYLDANCQACHQPGGAGPTWDARYDTPLAQQHITNYPALFSLGISDNACVVKSKDIWRSVLLARINTTDQNIQMPDFRNLIDTNAVQVIIAWINSLPGTPALAPAAITPNGGTFYNQVGVTIQAPDTNALVYYTLDGSLPTTNSLLYSGGLLLTSNLTISASAFETNFDNSIAVSAQFFVSPLRFISETYSNQLMQMTFLGSIGTNYVLQASTNLQSWLPLITNSAQTNLLYFVDPNSSKYPNRFYRMMQQ
ncbi:MAG TPA: chitobiase/beta-hexosaminidase C-terminal domain-containing protein [Verrucomicrobiae bacterium]|nr:chitobiase/beta-hexosaminidase C-terminal domain-containing protein [Verrucomicrobiae bacterium]